MKEEILKFIKTRFSKSETVKYHDSSCYYPWKDCSCKILYNIDYDTPLIKSGIIDSFSMTILFLFIEKTFEVEIPDKDMVLDNFESVNKIIEVITKLKSNDKI